ncbi:acetolactate synthase catalytic subunit [Sulfolobus sp. A20]|uniref:thiamine pyrophosphate-requiring protein n=2 Tax=Sulfolobaceae TaxID=118883 RepID=UPI00084607C6|nr:thiamine pyrophosphate-requiring protein [Sulfolobus sp. A20]TRM75893.1 thiamine pyrophosphate-requiring protein [Sulfolobus sp. A20-N-F8]TRM81845.1 thiamine pyrophosphate-requiring protein [Sulfolobus sp. D5]TRM89735.1 thiamine pyrophosphate-requiring protein [Sulfolobus sp. C3]TRN01201.1 thiamine pyrophosphate-requiring protein [Sulfolobus sp. F1]TRN03483.1 thiamine pyrophosphate-requiring protein [Sulfolobus sp. E1]
MNGGKAFLSLLKEFKVDRIFLVSGTDYPAFIEAKVEDPNLPELEVVPHEITAVSAAIGYSLGGKIGVVGVHTTPGTANALGGIMNAYTSRIPLLVIAGRSPYLEKGNTASRNLRIHWTQEARDQGEIVRQYVKYDFEVRRVEQIPIVVSRAFQIMLSEPRGPVYLVVPREVSVDEIKEIKKIPMDYYEPAPPADKLNKAKEMLEKAENPVIVTWRAGRRKSWFESLKRFAEKYNIPILNYVGEVLNYPSNGAMALDKFDLKRADLLLVIEAEVPYFPKKLDLDIPIIKVDVEPSYSYIPYYGFRCDLCIQSTPDNFLDYISLRPKNAEVIKELKAKQDEEKRRLIESLMDRKPIHPKYLSHEIGEIAHEYDLAIFNEYQFDPRYARLNEFGSYFADLSIGYLGFSLGAAVGYKMATNKDVIVTTGDGSFIFGVPEAFYYIGYRYPVMVVIYDNAGWLASAEAVNEVFPEGLARIKKYYPGADFSRFEIGKTVEAFHGYYELVEEPSEIKPALLRGLDKLRRENKIVVIQVIVDKVR